MESIWQTIILVKFHENSNRLSAKYIGIHGIHGKKKLKYNLK